MAAPVNKTSGYDLYNPDSFIRKTITPDEADERLKILEAAERALKDGEELTPRSLSEYNDLAILASRRDEEVLGREKVTRKAPAQFYHVMYNEDPSRALVSKFNRLNRKVVEMRDHVPGGSEVAILRNIIKPDESMQWYQAATLAEMGVIMKGDFLDGLKNGFFADINLLYSARCLHKNQTVFQAIMRLHQQSFDLCQDQVTFNRGIERSILTNARETQVALIAMRDNIITCGSTLTEVPSSFVEKSNAILAREDERTMQLCEDIKKESESFLEKLEPLKEGIKKAIKEITNEQKEVNDIIKKLNEAAERKIKLTKRQEDLQIKYDSFEEARKKERASRKTETHHGGFWIFSWRHTEVTEADFGSKELWQEYLSIKADSERLTQEIKQLEGELRDQIKSHSGSYATEEELLEASNSMSQAFSSILKLESAIKVKRQQSENQIKIIDSRMRNSSFRIETVSEAIDRLEDISGKVLNSHAIWIQSNRQCVTLQEVRMEENKLQQLVMSDLTDGGTRGRVALKARIEQINSQPQDHEESHFGVRLITNEQLLAITER